MSQPMPQSPASSGSLEKSLQRLNQRLGSPTFLWPLFLTVVTLLIYGQTFGFKFVNFDDDAHVYENPWVRSGLSWENLKWAFEVHGPSQWHPLAWLSHQLDWQLFADDPFGHHLSNVFCHWAGVILLFFAMNSLLRLPHAAGFIAAMFAVHPLNIESVAWVSERRNVLCGVFWMATLIAYAGYARHRDLKRYGWVSLWMMCALMAKPLAVTLPCVLLLLDFWPLRRTACFRNDSAVANSAAETWTPNSSFFLIAEKLPWLLMSAGASWLSYLCQKKINVVSDFATLSGSLRVENACVAYGLYLRRMFWPFDLAVFYPHPAWNHPRPDEVLFVPAMISAGVLLGCTLIALIRVKKQPGLIVGWLWFLGTFVPMIGLVQVGRQQLADRYAYLPMIGLGLMMVSVRWSSRIAKWVPFGAGLLVAFWFGVSLWQIRCWENSRLLFTRAIKVTEQNSWAHLNLGLAYQTEGNRSEAIRNYERALAIDANYVLAHYNLGIVWQDLERPDRAAQYFQQAVTIDPASINSWIRLGTVFGQLGQLASAEECFRKAIALSENSAQARFNLALVLESRNATAEALSEFEKSVRQEPASLHFRTGWMLALAKAGKNAEAREQAREILRREPTATAARQILSQLGRR